jgi:hypothetical protein
MKIFACLHPLRCRLTAACLLLPMVTASSMAQPAATPATGKQDKAIDARNDVAAIRSKREEGKILAKANNPAGAERALTEFNLAATGTASWHLETAQKLVQLAEDLGRSGKPALVPGLAQSALQHALRASQLATTPEAALGAKMMAGFISERYLANRAGALVYFRDAAQLAPQSPAAREAHERVKRIDETFREKQNSGGGR